MRACREGGAGHRDPGDELARPQGVLDVGRGPGQRVEGLQRHGPGTAGGAQVHHCVQSDQRDGQVAGMGSDACVARAEHGVAAVDPLQRRAAAAGLTLVARRRDVAEVAAPGALQQVAADARHVAQLGRRAQLQRLRDHRVVLPHGGIGGYVAHPFERTDVQPLVVQGDAAQREPVDVHDVVGGHHLELHQVDQGGTAGQEGGVRSRAPQGLAYRARLGEGVGPHQRIACCASRIASTMRG